MVVEVEILSRSDPETVFYVEITENDTCLDAINNSGLAPRDGSIIHALDVNGNIIDEKLAKDFIFENIFVDIIPKICNFHCKEVVYKKGKPLNFGKGKLDGGIIAFVPNFKEGMKKEDKDKFK